MVLSVAAVAETGLLLCCRKQDGAVRLEGLCGDLE